MLNEIAKLARLDVHGDPADELIGATSVVHVPLVTRDRVLRRSRLIPKP